MAISCSSFTSFSHVMGDMNYGQTSRRTPQLAHFHPFQAAAVGGHPKGSHLPFSSHFRTSSLSTTMQAILARETLPGISRNDVESIGWNTNSPGAESPLTLPPFFEVAEEETEKMKKWIKEIKKIFRNMKDGEISVSAYDTAWVARVPSILDSTRPQFPRSLDWIIKNQLSDGSWGEKDIFLVYDRICNTVGCLVALKSWNVGHENVMRGIKFVWSNMAKMADEGIVHMPIGFEIIFPALLEDAKEIGLDLPYKSPIVRLIEHERQKKLKSIPLDILHKYPTTLLHSLEGLHKLVDWNKLLSLQEKNGSFLLSPASTACALKYTGDAKCLQYLTYVLGKFGSAVPNVYPVDLFEHLWIVDRLQRLGISRYFESELKECLDYVYRYWSQNGISWARESLVQDIDDTAMAFRLLRLNGYDVSPDVFTQFHKNDEFFCFAGQTSQAVTGMFNFYRAAQTLFPGEKLLDKGRAFSCKFLQMKQQKGEVFDKWIIAKGLKGEVDYALSFPWYASLPRIETSEYLCRYGPDDIWIGKVLYKMPYVNNQTFLDLAKADFNLCQHIHQEELNQVLRWNTECEFDKLSSAYRHKAVECFFSIAATMFEPELASLRLVWARCCVLTTIIDDIFNGDDSLQEFKAFVEGVKRWDVAPIKGCSKATRVLFLGLYNTVNSISQEAQIAQGRDVSAHLRYLWVRLITTKLKAANWRLSGYMPSMQEYTEIAAESMALEPIILSSLFFVGPKLTDEMIRHKDYGRMMHLVNVIGRLLDDVQGVQRKKGASKYSSIGIYMRENPGKGEEDAIQHFKSIVDETTQQLVEEVLRPNAVPRECKQLHLSMAKILHLFYLKPDRYTYLAERRGHMQKVLFAPVA